MEKVGYLLLNESGDSFRPNTHMQIPGAGSDTVTRGAIRWLYLELPLRFDDLEGLKLVADLQVVVILHPDAAFVA